MHTHIRSTDQLTKYMLDVLNWLSVRHRILYRVCLSGLALPVYLIDSVSRNLRHGEVDPFALLRGGLGGPACACTSTMQNLAFSVVGPRVWNGLLPRELRLSPRSGTDAFSE